MRRHAGAVPTSAHIPSPAASLSAANFVHVHCQVHSGQMKQDTLTVSLSVRGPADENDVMFGFVRVDGRAPPPSPKRRRGPDARIGHLARRRDLVGLHYTAYQLPRTPAHPPYAPHTAQATVMAAVVGKDKQRLRVGKGQDFIGGVSEGIVGAGKGERRLIFLSPAAVGGRHELRGFGNDAWCVRVRPLGWR